MSLLDQLTDMGRNAAKKSGEMVDAAKLKLRISENKSIMKDYKTDIGAVIYEKYSRGEALEPALLELCQKIRAKEEENAALEAELQAQK